MITCSLQDQRQYASEYQLLQNMVEWEWLSQPLQSTGTTISSTTFPRLSCSSLSSASILIVPGGQMDSLANLYCHKPSLEQDKLFYGALALNWQLSPISFTKKIKKTNEIYQNRFVEVGPHLHSPWGHGCRGWHEDCLHVKVYHSTAAWRRRMGHKEIILITAVSRLRPTLSPYTMQLIFSLWSKHRHGQPFAKGSV